MPTSQVARWAIVGTTLRGRQTSPISRSDCHDVSRMSRHLGAALLQALIVLVTATCVPGTTTDHSSGSARELTGSINGASYLIRVPASWNGVLLLYSHGGGAFTPNPPAEDSTDPVTAQYLLQEGYALAGSSFRSSGWFVED